MPRGRLRANYCVILKLSFTHILPVSTWCLAFILSWHTQWRCCKTHFCNTSIFFRRVVLRKWRVVLRKWRVVSSKTTCCFFKNDVLFLRKRRVVSSKMTCCFFENDVLFLQKRRVTFSKRQVVFYGCLGVEKQHRRKRKRIPRILFVKIPIISLPRAHAYAHITGVFIFLLSQVSHSS